MWYFKSLLATSFFHPFNRYRFFCFFNIAHRSSDRSIALDYIDCAHIKCAAPARCGDYPLCTRNRNKSFIMCHGDAWNMETGARSECRTKRFVLFIWTSSCVVCNRQNHVWRQTFRISTSRICTITIRVLILFLRRPLSLFRTISRVDTYLDTFIHDGLSISFCAVEIIWFLLLVITKLPFYTVFDRADGDVTITISILM